MEQLFNTSDYYKAVTTYCSERNLPSPVNLNLTDLQFALDKNPCTLAGNGLVARPIVSVPAMKKVEDNMGRALSVSVSNNQNHSLLAEIHASQKHFDGKNDDEFLYEQSKIAEIRDTPLKEASTIIHKLKSILRSGLYESVQQETREHKDSLLDKIQTRIEGIKTRLHSPKEDNAPPSAGKEKTHSLLSTFVSKASDFVEKSKYFLAQFKTTPNDKVEIKNLDQNQLTAHMDQIVDDLIAYHVKHGGSMDFAADFRHKKTEGFSDIEGQKRFYSADTLMRLQQLMKTGFQEDSGKHIYNQLQRFVASNFMLNSSVINDLAGKEPTLIKMIREKVLPAMDELAHRQGFTFVEQKNRIDKYQLERHHETPQMPQTTKCSSVQYKQVMQEGRKEASKKDQVDTEHPHM